jgi:hypothetical protein
MTPIKISWRVPEKSRKKRWRSAAPEGETGWIVDVSVTGAAIEAPRSDDLFLGHRVRIALGEHQGMVVIRRAVPSTVERMARYGVEFVDLEPELADELRTLLEEERPEGLEALWQRAR